MATVQDYVIANLEAKHDLESLAEQFEMSPRNLMRLFKKECGMSFMNYVNDARIDVARRYLVSIDLSYKKIAQYCAIESAEALRRIFVRRLDITP